MAYDTEHFNGRSVDEEKPDRIAYYLRIAILAIVGCGLLYAVDSLARPLAHPTPVEELYTSAIKYGGYEEACASRQDGCPMPSVLIVWIEDSNIAGQFYFRNPEVVKMNSQVHTPGTLEWNATLVHEFVHYLQWLTGKLGPQTPCQQRLEIEEPAYKAAGEYLAQFGIVKDYKAQLSDMAFFAALCGMPY